MFWDYRVEEGSFLLIIAFRMSEYFEIVTPSTGNSTPTAQLQDDDKAWSIISFSAGSLKLGFFKAFKW